MVGTVDTAREPLARFRSDGVLRVSDAVDQGEVAALKGRFWHEVEQAFGIVEANPETWLTQHDDSFGSPGRAARGRRLGGMNPVMANLVNDGSLAKVQAGVHAQVAALFGPGRWEPLDRWYSLLSFPGDQSTWTVPRGSWHHDEPIVVGDPEPWSIFVFVFLDRVALETGPTMAVAGSHRRGEQIAIEHGVIDERQVRAFDRGLTPDPAAVRLLPVGELLPALRSSDPWFADLAAPSEGDDRDGSDGSDGRTQRFMDEGTVRGDIASRVVGMTGDAGDIVLFDPRCLHTPSANVSTLPRQILRLDFCRTTPPAS